MNIRALFLLTISMCNVGCAMMPEEVQKDSRPSQHSGETSETSAPSEHVNYAQFRSDMQQQAAANNTSRRGLCSCFGRSVPKAQEIQASTDGATNASGISNSPSQQGMAGSEMNPSEMFTQMKDAIKVVETLPSGVDIFDIDGVRYLIDHTGVAVQKGAEFIKHNCLELLERVNNDLGYFKFGNEKVLCSMEEAARVTLGQLTKAKEEINYERLTSDAIDGTLEKLEGVIISGCQVFIDQDGNIILQDNATKSATRWHISAIETLRNLKNKMGNVGMAAAVACDLPTDKAKAKDMARYLAASGVGATLGMITAAAAVTAVTAATGGAAIPVLITSAGVSVVVGFVGRQVATGAMKGGELAAGYMVRRLSGKLNGNAMVSAAEANGALDDASPADTGAPAMPSDAI